MPGELCGKYLGCGITCKKPKDHKDRKGHEFICFGEAARCRPRERKEPAMAESKRVIIQTTVGTYTAYREEGFRDPSDVLAMIRQAKAVPCEGVANVDVPISQGTNDVLFQLDHVVAVFDAEF